MHPAAVMPLSLPLHAKGRGTLFRYTHVQEALISRTEACNVQSSRKV